jgi:hypothetical protein
MVVHMNLDAVSASTPTAGDIPAFPTAIGNTDASITAVRSVSARDAFPAAGQYTRWTYNYVDLQGTILDRTTATPANFVRYCEYPGERVFKKVRFDVNGNPLDEYDATAMIMHQKFKVQPGKEVGWNRLVGQENPVDCYTDLCSIAGASIWGAQHINLTAFGTTTASPVSPVSSVLTARRQGKILNGYQTPKVTQPALDMWIPLLFWFNRDCQRIIGNRKFM